LAHRPDQAMTGQAAFHTPAGVGGSRRPSRTAAFSCGHSGLSKTAGRVDRRAASADPTQPSRRHSEGAPCKARQTRPTISPKREKSNREYHHARSSTPALDLRIGVSISGRRDVRDWRSFVVPCAGPLLIRSAQRSRLL
jgi:hypothetical protein